MPENRFNLIDEPWIPVVDVGRVSLKDIFSNPNLKALGGNPVQKIALTKLLLAIAQSANTPENDQAQSELGADGLAKACLAYLEKWRNRFYLYGEKPFLQMPVIVEQIQKSKSKDKSARSYGMGFYPDLASENNTILSQYQIEKSLNDAEKAVFLVTLMNFALGGKRIIKNVPALTESYSGKSNSAKSGPSLGNYVGYLHSYLIGVSLQETIWLNLVSHDEILKHKNWTSGLGIAPWELMPKGENDKPAQELKSAYMGTLVALSRFVFLEDNGIYYLEGIQYPSHKEGWFELSVTQNSTTNPPKMLWLDTEKKPWRELTTLLAFFDSRANTGFSCRQLQYGFNRISRREEAIGIWSGGLKVRGTSGDQSVKQDDDFVESFVVLPPPNQITGSDSIWFENLQSEMSELDLLAKTLYGCVMSYYKHQLVEGKNQAAQATNLFWQLCESRFQALVNGADDEQQRLALRKVFAGFVHQAFELYCPKETARQLDSWAQSRPNLSKYLAQTNKEVA
ncbi:MAG: type I-E CRISPR-associated protein Cse1/CasA [Thiomicrorhabdus chilensis]|uniref:type I-E CRISPR-associated protein Cse1/CasA n=1 Tax=Thiomicrorhabdus chilensis TaxID=63656 RepID=UPI00299CFC2E|nr:type I-E CRISPR-associated protein Cse1/CasA [Thiomicrorhabdus chilensis]MDX1348093.1 type I-E CRISPR-associated protein Cse1/CasA [Thiomicrorhabdus chilensis]